jgi:hypothetical protein
MVRQAGQRTHKCQCRALLLYKVRMGCGAGVDFIRIGIDGPIVDVRRTGGDSPRTGSGLVSARPRSTERLRKISHRNYG